MSNFVNLPEIPVSKDLIERIQFSVSSRNAEAKVGECATHFFAARYVDDPHDISWQYVASGVACLLRNRELTKNGRKYFWSVNLCLYNANYGVLVWKGKLQSNCDYTAVADNFHVFALGEVDVIVGLLFTNREHACELNTTYTMWQQERIRDEGRKGPSSSSGSSGNQTPKFKKAMISKPCNFMHIQGTQALDECLEIEKIKADIIAAFFGLGTKAGRSETEFADTGRKAHSKKKKEIIKKRLSFKEILVPATSLSSPPVSPPLSAPPMDSRYLIEQQNSIPVFSVEPGVQSSGEFVNSHQSNGDVFVPPPQPQEVPYYDQQQQPPSYDNLQPQQEMNYQDQQVQQEFVQEVVPVEQPVQLQQEFIQEVPIDQHDQQVQYEFQSYVEPQPNNNNSQYHSDNSEASLPSDSQMKSDFPTFGDENIDYDLTPPRLEFDLEKELLESFQSPLMTAN